MGWLIFILVLWLLCGVAAFYLAVQYGDEKVETFGDLGGCMLSVLFGAIALFHVLTDQLKNKPLPWVKK